MLAPGLSSVHAGAMNKHKQLVSRRNMLRVVLAGGVGCALHPGLAQHAPEPAQAWRALSRLGYGPNPELLADQQAAGGARQWALAQVDAAFDASHQAPRIAPDMADFHQPLPQLFDGVQQERLARAKIRADGEKPELEARRFDFSGEHDPLYFSRLVSQQAIAWRLHASSRPSVEVPLLARMTEFWFNHLNVYSGKGAVRPFAGHYAIAVARAHALGKYEDLVLASARHPAMLYYLDQVRSVAEGTASDPGGARGLNENYARELMELHTLGVDGGYAQRDVRELARVLTGWTVAPKSETGFRFTGRLHDAGTKQLLGLSIPGPGIAAGEEEGRAAIRMLARHPSTARRVSLRLAQFFVSDLPPDDLVGQLSQTFIESQGDLREVMRALISSEAFWQAENRLFKTPMDYACSVLCATQGAQERRNLVLATGFLAGAGQPLHGWQTPDGYKTDAATWLVPEALSRRADFALAAARQTPELEFLQPFLSIATRNTLASEKPPLRAGLALASPEFMFK